MAHIKMIAKTTLLCIVFVSGCVAPQKQEESIKIKNSKQEEGSKVSCQANDYHYLVGKDYEKVKSELPKHRWKRPDFLYTQEYIPERLNVVTDESRIIIAIKCG